MITIERPDWTAMTELTSTFRSEARMSITSTRGHAELIKQVLARRTEVTTAEQLAKQARWPALLRRIFHHFCAASTPITPPPCLLAAPNCRI